MNKKVNIKEAKIADVPLILQFIKELAEYEKLSHEVVATEEILSKHYLAHKHILKYCLL